MRLARTGIAILVTALVAWPALAEAQEPVRDFTQLNTRLKPGDTVWVTDAQGREVKGTIFSLATEALTLEGRSGRTYGPSDVTTIQVRRADSLRNGALIGLGIGGGLALAGCLGSVDSDDAGWCVLAALFYGGVGAGIGVGIDAMTTGKKIMAYRAPGPSGAPSARVSFAPVITPRARGVAVLFSF